MTDRMASPEALSYEQAREELIVIVQRLESGGVPLEESLALRERGEQLAAVRQAWLMVRRPRSTLHERMTRRQPGEA